MEEELNLLSTSWAMGVVNLIIIVLDMFFSLGLLKRLRSWAVCTNL